MTEAASPARCLSGSLENLKLAMPAGSTSTLAGAGSDEKLTQAPATAESLELALSVPRPTPVSELLLGEVTACAEHINNLLRDVPELQKNGYLPITAENDLFFAARDGVLLAQLLAKCKPQAFAAHAAPLRLEKLQYDIPWSQLGQNNSKVVFELNAQLGAVIKAFAACGVIVVNVGAEDVLCRRVDLVLGLVWQLLRAHLLQRVNVQSTPALLRLLQPGESIEVLIRLSSEQLVLRWFNYHLVRSREAGANWGAPRQTIANFSADISSGEEYLSLLRQVLFDQPACLAALDAPLRDGETPVDRVLQVAELAGVRQFVTAADIRKGNSRLNLAFTATIFNRYLGIHLPSEDSVRAMIQRIGELERTVAAHVESERLLGSDLERTVAERAESERLRAADGEIARLESETAARTLADTQSNFDAAAERAARLEQTLAAVQQVLSGFTQKRPSALPAHVAFEQVPIDAAAYPQLPEQLERTLNVLAAHMDEQHRAHATLSTQFAQTQKLNLLMSEKIGEVAESMIEDRKKQFKVVVGGKKATDAASKPSAPVREPAAGSSLSPAF